MIRAWAQRRRIDRAAQERAEVDALAVVAYEATRLLDVADGRSPLDWANLHPANQARYRAIAAAVRRTLR